MDKKTRENSRVWRWPCASEQCWKEVAVCFEEKGGELCKEPLLFHSGQMPTLTGSLGLRGAPRRYLATVT